MVGHIIKKEDLFASTLGTRTNAQPLLLMMWFIFNLKEKIS
jgi:hypothetical protein